MAGYIVRRIIRTIIVLLGISIITFFMIFSLPADPAQIIAGPHASQAVLNAVRIKYGLNQPLPLQYLHYMGRLLHGDMGTSYIYNRPVVQMIFGRFGPTAFLALSCFIAELLIGIPLGIYTARHARKLGDYIWSALALVGISLPVYWLGLIFLYYFAFKLPIFPLGGSGGFMYVVLPALTYGITGAAAYLRLLKSSMLEVMSQDYVRTARAKGASEGRVVRRHILRNALIPVITYGGIEIGYLLSGILLIEATFNWNGLGELAYTSISQLDTPIIMGTVLFTACFVVIFNFIVDLLYGIIDPRIRYE